MIMEGGRGRWKHNRYSLITLCVNRSGVLNLMGDDFTAGRCHEYEAVKNPRKFDLGWLQRSRLAGSDTLLL